ncbi:MAG: hypothetical protein LBF86_00780 [Helicobacteraceae bacterium]|nr:hypothetical protein [Helicobacteraceae bacterium]
MKRVVVIWFLCLSALCAAAVKDARTDFIDGTLELTLFLDSAFNGKISQTREDSQIVLTIEELQTPSPYVFAPKKGDLVSTLRVSPRDRQTIVRISPKREIVANAVISDDKKTLSIRLSADADAAPPKSPFDGIELTQSYMLAGIFIACLLLLWIVVRLLRGGSSGSWLLGKTKEETVSIVWQKPIDGKNRFLLARFRDKEYLLLIGQNNLLLDSNGKNAPIDDEAFDALLRANSVKLSDYLKDNQSSKKRSS